MHCLNRRTGATVWQFTASGVINVAPIVSGDVLYVVCIGQTLYALNALSGEEIWRYKTEGRLKCMPLVWHSNLFVFCEDRSVLAFAPGAAQ